nr:MAG TPA: Cas system-associated protein [Caudoviricetes sp.]
MNCNHWKISFPCFGFQYSTLGGKLRFNSVYWNFLLREGL